MEQEGAQEKGILMSVSLYVVVVWRNMQEAITDNNDVVDGGHGGGGGLSYLPFFKVIWGI